MSRQLDLQLYLALNGYPLKEIPEELYEDYMSEPHYSTDAEAMFELDGEMRERGYNVLEIYRGRSFLAATYVKDGVRFDGAADNMLKATALAAYKALTGKEWDNGGDS